jgi:hypothetical protein
LPAKGKGDSDSALDRLQRLTSLSSAKQAEIGGD